MTPEKLRLAAKDAVVAQHGFLTRSFPPAVWWRLVYQMERAILELPPEKLSEVARQYDLK